MSGDWNSHGFRPHVTRQSRTTRSDHLGLAGGHGGSGVPPAACLRASFGSHLAETKLGRLEWVTSLGVGVLCRGRGLAFLVATRHATYRRAARQAEWGVLALAAQYLFLALARLHATHDTSSILVSRLETGLEADLGPLGRLAVVTALFAVIGGYVAVLLWRAHLSPFLEALLGTSLMLFWYWGPCGVWGQDFVDVFLAVQRGLAGDLTALVLWPSLPRILVPLVLMYWAVWTVRRRRWSLSERVSLGFVFRDRRPVLFSSGSPGLSIIALVLGVELAFLPSVQWLRSGGGLGTGLGRPADGPSRGLGRRLRSRRRLASGTVKPDISPQQR